MIVINHKTKKKLVRIFAVNIPLVLLFIVTVFPLYWTIVTSLKPETEIMKLPLKYWPVPVTFDNYRYIWENMGFDVYFWNSVLVTTVSTVVCTIISLFGGYAIARYRFKGKKMTYLILLISQMFPGVVLMIPLFETFRNMGIVNSPYSLILTYATVRIPFCMIMISGFVAGVSPALEEAAQIDGCSVMGAITRVVVPTIAPGLVAAGAFSFNTWFPVFRPEPLRVEHILILIQEGGSYEKNSSSNFSTQHGSGTGRMCREGADRVCGRNSRNRYRDGGRRGHRGVRCRRKRPE